MSETALAPEIKDLGDKIANLTIVQAVALKYYLKDTYKIEPAAGGGGGGGGGAGAAAAAPRRRPRNRLSFPWFSKADTMPPRRSRSSRSFAN